MTRVQRAADFTLQVVVIAGAITAPLFGLVVLIGVVATSIFALQALANWVEHRSLYQKTLTHFRREPFGRISGQDYSRWNGKARAEARGPFTSKGQYFYGGRERHFFLEAPCACKQSIEDGNPFDSVEDAFWLRLELKRVTVKNALDHNLKMARAFAKAILPVAGFFWILKTEIGVGGTIINVFVPPPGDSWDLPRAINFQLDVLKKRGVRI